MIKVRYSAVDGFSKRKSFKSLKGARKYAIEMLGKYPSFGSYYAVSDDGVGKIEVISGCKLRDLFGDEPGAPLDWEAEAFEVYERERAARERAEIEAEAEKMNRVLRAHRVAGCVCSEQQLNLVGCGCAASRGENQ